ncbi:chromatin modification-related protein EAF6 [Blastocystis sp. ATCC 50177/Nand II]|uniref:Chromatin modification-related protein EAF6 n=1 Tax=Blastocystis sp. subtype 1 (strain ATCC 50177 / NandII) TaxID=478820 RepID=A0A196SKW9_BLAHN|nr:chromatin modification-related protein EAF6 [Blastocystis sp. ATCC 50177/Nand II]
MEEKGYKSDQDQLRMLVTETNNLNDTLAKLENQILTVETQYLQEDCPVWNIVRGFENFNERLQSIPRRTVITRDDRIFSLSSHASPAMNLPMDDDNRSVGSVDSANTHKLKRNKRKRSPYGEDDYE